MDTSERDATVLDLRERRSTAMARVRRYIPVVVTWLPLGLWLFVDAWLPHDRGWPWPPSPVQMAVGVAIAAWGIWAAWIVITGWSEVERLRVALIEADRHRGG